MSEELNELKKVKDELLELFEMKKKEIAEIESIHTEKNYELNQIAFLIIEQNEKIGRLL